jgi:hypothetical protein
MPMPPSPGLTRFLRRHPELAPRFANGIDHFAVDAMLFAYEIAASQCETADDTSNDIPRLPEYQRLRDEAEEAILAVVRLS